MTDPVILMYFAVLLYVDQSLREVVSSLVTLVGLFDASNPGGHQTVRIECTNAKRWLRGSVQDGGGSFISHPVRFFVASVIEVSWDYRH